MANDNKHRLGDSGVSLAPLPTPGIVQAAATTYLVGEIPDLDIDALILDIAKQASTARLSLSEQCSELDVQVDRMNMAARKLFDQLARFVSELSYWDPIPDGQWEIEMDALKVNTVAVNVPEGMRGNRARRFRIKLAERVDRRVIPPRIFFDHARPVQADQGLTSDLVGGLMRELAADFVASHRATADICKE